MIWGHISDAVRQAASENMSTVEDDLRVNQIKRWQAVGMLNTFCHQPMCHGNWRSMQLISCFLLLMEMTHKDVMMSMLCATVEVTLLWTWVWTPKVAIYSFWWWNETFQAITKVIMYSPNTTLRRNAFEAMKKVRVLNFHLKSSEPVPWYLL